MINIEKERKVISEAKFNVFLGRLFMVTFTFGDAREIYRLFQTNNKLAESVASMYIDSSLLSEYFLIAFYLMLGLIALVIFTLDNHVFHLNDIPERERYLYRWINQLKKSKRLNSKREFDEWMGDFKSRYSELELEIMKLNFKD